MIYDVSQIVEMRNSYFYIIYIFSVFYFTECKVLIWL